VFPLLEWEESCSSALSLTSALDVDGWSAPRIGCFTTRKETWCSMYWNLGGLRGRFGRVPNISPHRSSNPGPANPKRFLGFSPPPPQKKNNVLVFDRFWLKGKSLKKFDIGIYKICDTEISIWRAGTLPLAYAIVRHYCGGLFPSIIVLAEKMTDYKLGCCNWFH